VSAHRPYRYDAILSEKIAEAERTYEHMAAVRAANPRTSGRDIGAAAALIRLETLKGIRTDLLVKIDADGAA
jgi:hypothetical protein